MPDQDAMLLHTLANMPAAHSKFTLAGNVPAACISIVTCITLSGCNTMHALLQFLTKICLSVNHISALQMFNSSKSSTFVPNPNAVAFVPRARRPAEKAGNTVNDTLKDGVACSLIQAVRAPSLDVRPMPKHTSAARGMPLSALQNAGESFHIELGSYVTSAGHVVHQCAIPHVHHSRSRGMV